jgi:hypothetical protein
MTLFQIEDELSVLFYAFGNTATSWRFCGRNQPHCLIGWPASRLLGDCGYWHASSLITGFSDGRRFKVAAIHVAAQPACVVVGEARAHNLVRRPLYRLLLRPRARFEADWRKGTTTLHSHFHSRNQTGAWRDLVFGSNVALLVLLAANITSGAPCAFKNQREKLKEFSKRLKAGIPQISATAQLITDFNLLTMERHVDLKRFADLPTQLRAYAHDIAGFAKIAAELSSNRHPKTADYALFFLHGYRRCIRPFPGRTSFDPRSEPALAKKNVVSTQDQDDRTGRRRIAGAPDDQRAMPSVRQALQPLEKG